MSKSFPAFSNVYGNPDGGIDMLPKPISSWKNTSIYNSWQPARPRLHCTERGRLVNLSSQYRAAQAKIFNDWRTKIKEFCSTDKPVSPSLYIDLTEDPETPPQPIHLGFRSGTKHLRHIFNRWKKLG